MINHCFIYDIYVHVHFPFTSKRFTAIEIEILKMWKSEKFGTKPYEETVR